MVDREFYRKVLEIDDAELLDLLLSITQTRRLERKELLIRMGEAQEQIVFLVSGFLRGFLLNDEGREITDCFGIWPGTAAMGAFALHEPSPISIEALTEAEVVWMPVKRVEALFAEHPALLEVYNRYLRKALNVHWELKTMIAQESALKRYRWFQKSYPGLEAYLLDRHLASFLGMTPVTLSRLRRRLRDGTEEA